MLERLVVAPLAACLLSLTACDDAGVKGPPVEPPPPEGDAAVAPTGDGGGLPADATVPGADASPPPATQAVRIIVEPSDRGAALLAAVQGAKRSVHVMMYMLTSDAIENALVAQKNAGRDVKVILNARFPPGVTGNPNQPAYDALSRAGVPVKWAPSTFTYTHAKLVTVDGAESWIMTMNATNTSAETNREYLAIDTDPADVAEAEEVFGADFTGAGAKAQGKLLVAPGAGARAPLEALIDSAKRSLDLEAEELSDRSIVAKLVAARQRGVAVKIVIASGNTFPAQRDAIAALKGAGAQVVALDSPMVHAKSIVADGAWVYVGSINFTFGSIESNRELGVITTAASEVAKVLSTTQADFAAGAPQ